MTNENYLIVVEPTQYSPDIIHAADVPGITTVFITPFKGEVEHLKKLVPGSRVVLVETDDVDEWIKKLPPRDNIIGVQAGNEMAVHKSAAVAEKIDKGNYLPLKDALACRFKDLMRIRLDEHQVPVPNFHVIRNEKEGINAAADIGYPCIVKPTDQCASFNVKLVHSDEELVKAVESIANSTTYGTVYAPEEILTPWRVEMLVEEYVEGPEFSIEGFSMGGKIVFESITEKLSTGSPQFIEVGHNVPACLTEELESELFDCNRKTLKALGITEGASHCEIKITATGPKVIECACRQAGDKITKLVDLSYEFDLNKAFVHNTLGMEIDATKELIRHSAIRFITFSENKTVKQVNFSPEDLEKLEGMVEANIDIKAGTKIREHKATFDRCGYIIVKGQSREKAISNVENALEYIKNGLIFED